MADEELIESLRRAVAAVPDDLARQMLALASLLPGAAATLAAIAMAT